MAVLDLKRKLAILSDAAKYDASCASSGAPKRDSLDGKGVGLDRGGMGICHAYAPDGRCICLLKILLTNFCIYDCAYCINRVSSNTPRARFAVRGGRRPHPRLLQAQLHRGPVPLLGHHPQRRLHHGGDGAGGADPARGPRLPRLHPPEGDPRGRAGPGRPRPALYADRVSINIELPRDDSLARAGAGEGRRRHQARPWARCGWASTPAPSKGRKAKAKPPKFAPAGQSTQMIVGADAASDGEILARSETPLRRLCACGGSTIPPSARSRTPPRACRWPRRR